MAVKILKEELLQDKKLLSDFQKEAKASVSMSHENIVEIYEEGIWNSLPYLAMEYLNSQTLLDRIEYLTKFNINEACLIMKQLLLAIECTHKHGIIHRDIKPQNIFYLSNGMIKLGDFGIAKKENEFEDHEQVVGSVHYLAPEVITSRKFSVSSDLYAAGMTFYQLVTGVLPFDGTTNEIAQKQVKNKVRKPSEINSLIPKDLDTIILKALNKNPSARYRSAKAFLDDIEAFLSGKKIKTSFISRLF